MVLANQHARVERESAAQRRRRRRLRLWPGDRPRGDGARASTRRKRAGLCAIAIRNAGHLGRIGAWAEQVADAGLASIHFVNTSGFGILVAPHGGSDRRLSANPIAAGAPGRRRADHPRHLHVGDRRRQDPGRAAIEARRCRRAARSTATAGRTRIPRRSTVRRSARCCRSAATRATGCRVFCEIFAGALTGGLTTNPANATAGRLVNNMLSIVFDADAFCGAQAFRDGDRAHGGVGAGVAARRAGGDVLLPGEIERRTRAERERDGVPLDAETRRRSRSRRAIRLRCSQMPQGVRTHEPNPVREKLRAGGTPIGVMAFDFFTPGLAPTLAQRRRRVRAARHGAQRRRHRHDQGAMRARARRRHRADRARAGVPASPDRAGARRRRDRASWRR